jgi:hypothetical protein
MGMRMGARLAATVDMRFRFERNWNDHDLPGSATESLGLHWCKKCWSCQIQSRPVNRDKPATPRPV